MANSEITARDTAVFKKELLRFSRIARLFIVAGIAMAIASIGGFAPLIAAVGMLCFTLMEVGNAYRDSKAKRFIDPRIGEIWAQCKDRVDRLKSSLGGMKQKGVADLTELPKTVDKLADDIYHALRRADLVIFEASESERNLSHPTSYTLPRVPDQHSQELLQVAERNIAEYKSHMNKVLSGVQRTEAQAMVFITTLDTLRARMLGYTANTKISEVNNAEFLSVVKEARMQFDAIDKALIELDEPSTLRSQLANSPPPIPEALRAMVELNQATQKSEDKAD